MNIISHRYRLRSIDKPTNIIYIYIYIYILYIYIFLISNSLTPAYYLTSIVHLRPSQHKNKREFCESFFYFFYFFFLRMGILWKLVIGKHIPLSSPTNFIQSVKEPISIILTVKNLIMKKLFFHSDINSTRFWV